MTLTVLWAYRRTGKFAFHVLTGALEAAADLADLPIGFANGVAPLRAAIEQALATSARVLVGWSFYSPDFRRLAAELHAVRESVRDPRVLHVAGGVHASAEPLQTLQAGWDLVALGEGEQIILDLVRTLRTGADPRGVAGIGWLQDGVLRKNPKPPRIELDAFPPFGLAHARLGPIEITRGCLYACKFCQTPYFSGAAFRHRSVANVRAWTRILAQRGFSDYRFLTPTALSYGTSTETPDLAAVEALLAAVREEVGSSGRIYFGTFPSEVRPEHVTREALQVIRRYADNRTLILGGQSGSDRVLDAAMRGHDAATILRAAQLTHAEGFVPHVDFLFGLPGEEAADRQATLDLMDQVVAAGGRVHAHTFMPLPGTPFRAEQPGRVVPELRRRLKTLAAQGALYGQWEQQEVLARDLATPEADSAIRP